MAYRPRERAILEATVALDSGAVGARRELPGALPPLGQRQVDLVGEDVPAHAGRQAALRARGVSVSAPRAQSACRAARGAGTAPRAGGCDARGGRGASDGVAARGAGGR